MTHAAALPAPLPAAEAKPKSGGVLRLAVSNDFYDFDPTYNGSGTPNNYGTMLTYDTLVGFRTG